ncbi:hypothetical protein [Brevibacterium sp. 'Marine']|uniref:hypothetical protein n=1 Tax=Brevibacterium sp. 'Marine' TaxID=2725563 RepID=UPI00145F6E7B|nr:hypothetical protein [Brevibacterium sp. 'Marine']
MNFEAVHVLHAPDNLAEAARLPVRPPACAGPLAPGPVSALNSRFGERKPKFP